MPRLTSNSVSISLRMLYLSCVKIRELHCPAKTERKLALGEWFSAKFYCLFLLNYYMDLLQNLSEFSLGGPLPNLLKSGCYPYFYGIMGNMDFLASSLKIFIYKTTYQKSFIFGFGESPWDLVFSFFQLGHCDLYFWFYRLIFFTHINDFSHSNCCSYFFSETTDKKSFIHHSYN